MNILTQDKLEKYIFSLLDQLDPAKEERLQEIISPFRYNPTPRKFAGLVSEVSLMTGEVGRRMIKMFLEEADMRYRDSDDRKAKYYIKEHRKRTIVTMYGSITYCRTLYQARDSKKIFCYLDRQFGLSRGWKYAPDVRSYAYEAYADENSMIKVGKELGSLIYSHYSLDSVRQQHALPRQSIYNFFRSVKPVHVRPTRLKETPSTLYLMADEKYIHQQKNASGHNEDIMTKAIICLEGRKKIGKNRYKFINRYLLLPDSRDWKPWDAVLEVLSQRYDLDKVKTIYLLGDGASWIKSGVQELSLPKVKIRYGLDRFHALQAVNRMTENLNYQKLLADYLNHNLKKDFVKVVDSILMEKPEREKQIIQNRDYLLSNWKGIQVIYHDSKIGCAMEQVISHDIASQFSSVPKAYSSLNLPSYTSMRQNYRNDLDMKHIYFSALENQKSDQDIIDINPEQYDFSIFEPQSESDDYKLNFSNEFRYDMNYSY